MKPTKEQIRKVMDEIKEIGGISLETVSYTHLTLPTILRV